MNEFSWDWLGLAAGTLTTASFVPQVWKVWTSKSAEDLSLGMFAAFSAGVACWLGYGIVKADLPVIVANSVTFVLASSILVMKIAFGRRRGS